MFNNSGYDHDTDQDVCREDLPLLVNSCGHYRLLEDRAHYSTSRPNGRRDFQLLYVASGKGWFGYEAADRELTEGEIFLYQPGEAQAYAYQAQDRPDIYWIHFTGFLARNRMQALCPARPGMQRVGILEDYPRLFDRIIRELQLKREGYSPLCCAYAEEMFLLMTRFARQPGGAAADRNRRIEAVVERMHQEIAGNRTVEDYAQDCHMGTCWFIRSFRDYTGYSPRQFLIHLKINKARELLSYSSYNISEIAALVGYDNPLYFSRIFSRCMGSSPSEYRARSRAGQ